MLVRAYNGVSRSLRQTLALLAKLKADRARAEREAAQHEGWIAPRQPMPEPEPEEPAVSERAEPRRVRPPSVGFLR